MPPKIQYSRERILDAAVELTRKNGFETLSARNLGAYLGCSSKPLFTAFKNMDEIEAEVIEKSREILADYLAPAFAGSESFRRIGMQWVHFAKEEPNLYRLIFMTPGKESVLTLSDITLHFTDLLENILNTVERDFGLTRDEAMIVYNRGLLIAHSIASLSITGAATFSDEEVLESYTDVILGLVDYLKKKRTKEDSKNV